MMVNRSGAFIVVIGIISCIMPGLFTSCSDGDGSGQFPAITPTPVITFTTTFGSEGRDSGRSVLQTVDGGYIICGNTVFAGNDAYLIKTDASGAAMWSKTYGGDYSDGGACVQETTDGGFILCGVTQPHYSESFYYLMYLVRTDSEGNELWSRHHGGYPESYAAAVRQTGDGGFIICGGTNAIGNGGQDVYLLRTDESGNKLWSRTFGTEVMDYGNDVRVLPDGGFIVCGYTRHYNLYTSVYVVRTDSSGNELWSKNYGHELWSSSHGERMAYARSVQQTPDGGFILCGAKLSEYGDGYDVLLIRTDGNGEVRWQTTHGGQSDDEGWMVDMTTDGGFVVCGKTTSCGAGREDVLLIRTDSSGEELWARQFGGARDDAGYSIRQTTDGGFIISGSTISFGTGGLSDIYLIKTDSAGIVH